MNGCRILRRYFKGKRKRRKGEEGGGDRILDKEGRRDDMV